MKLPARTVLTMAALLFALERGTRPGTSAPVPSRDEVLLVAYSELNANARHYSRLRFVLWSAFLAGSGGLFAVHLGKDAGVLSSYLPFAGVAITLLFLLLELTVNSYVNHFQTRARALEVRLGIEGWRDMKDRWGHPILLAFIVILLLVWLLLAYAGPRVAGTAG